MSTERVEGRQEVVVVVVMMVVLEPLCLLSALLTAGCVGLAGGGVVAAGRWLEVAFTTTSLLSTLTIASAARILVTGSVEVVGEVERWMDVSVLVRDVAGRASGEEHSLSSLVCTDGCTV